MPYKSLNKNAFFLLLPALCMFLGVLFLSVKNVGSGGLSHVQIANAADTQLPRISLNDFQYLGGFLIPKGQYGPKNKDSFNYSDGGIGYDPSGDRFFMVGHAQGDHVAVFNNPGLTLSADFTTFKRATMQQNFSAIIGRASPKPANIDVLTGFTYVDGVMLGTGLNYYDASGSVPESIYRITNPNDIATSPIDGFYNSGFGAHTSGWISPIPSEWQAKFQNHTYVAGGSSGWPIIGRLSVGPSLFTFNPSNLQSMTKHLDFELASGATNWLPTRQLAADLSNTNLSNKLWTHLSQTGYGFIVPGTRTYVTIGQSGGHDSGVCYKCVNDLEQLYGGYGSYLAADNHFYYWLWDLDEILTAANPWDPRPYEYGKFPSPINSPSKKIGGGTYDPASGILYVVVESVETKNYANLPAVIAYKFNVDSQPPADTVLPNVSLSFPLSDAVVSGITTVSAVASDNVSVDSVQFKLDGANLGSADISAPYSISWDTTQALNGSHTLTAVTVDTSGNTATSPSITVIVDNQIVAPINQSPSVSAGQDQIITLPATAVLSGTATDDGLPLGSALTKTWTMFSGPGTVIFDNPSALNTTARFSTTGTYVLRLSVSDSILTTTAGMQVTVQLPPPTVTLSATPTSITAGQPVTLAWSSKNADNIAIDQSIGAVSASGIAQLTIATTTTYRITAANSAGSATDAVTVTVTVNPSSQCLDADGDGVVDKTAECSTGKDVCPTQGKLTDLTSQELSTYYPRSSEFNLIYDTADDPRSLSDFKIKKQNRAEVAFANTVNLVKFDPTNGCFKPLDVDTTIAEIGEKRVKINSVAFPDLNKEATITFYNVGNLVNPIIEKDGQKCAAPACRIVSHDKVNQTIIIGVLGFSEYTIVDDIPVSSGGQTTSSGGKTVGGGGSAPLAPSANSTLPATSTENVNNTGDVAQGGAPNENNTGIVSLGDPVSDVQEDGNNPPAKTNMPTGLGTGNIGLLGLIWPIVAGLVLIMAIAGVIFLINKSRKPVGGPGDNIQS